MEKLRKRFTPPRLIALGFLAVILVGSGLLVLPISASAGVRVSFLDAFYTSTSAVCVTGLVTKDVGATFSPFGQSVIALLIQIGGLGVTSVGAGVMLAMRKKMGFKSRLLIREGANFSSGKGVILFLKSVFLTTFVIEGAGVIANFCVFIRLYPFSKALGLSVFHAVSAFNNAGFDIFGTGDSLARFRDNAPLNLITAALIILGGLGFLVIRELLEKRFSWKKLSMHARVVLSVTATLLVLGTILFKLTENFSVLGAFFTSVTTRTAGFATYDFGAFSKAGLILTIVLMFIGASPGSTGGGVKTTTVFVLFHGVFSAATGKSEKAFHYSLPKDAFRKAAVIVLIGTAAILGSSFLVSLTDPQFALSDILFEMTSAFGTVGLSTGITPYLSDGGKIISIVMMYIGRLGPLTIASVWYFNKGESVRFPTGNLTVG